MRVLRLEHAKDHVDPADFLRQGFLGSPAGASGLRPYPGWWCWRASFAVCVIVVVGLPILFLGEQVIELAFASGVGCLVCPVAMLFAWTAHDFLIGAGWPPGLAVPPIFFGSGLASLISCCHELGVLLLLLLAIPFSIPVPSSGTLAFDGLRGLWDRHRSATCPCCFFARGIVIGDLHERCHCGHPAVASLLTELVAQEWILGTVNEGVDHHLIGNNGQGVPLLEPSGDAVADGLVISLDDVVEVIPASRALVSALEVAYECCLEVNPSVDKYGWS